jgi:hypothetical protein
VQASRLRPDETHSVRRVVMLGSVEAKRGPLMSSPVPTRMPHARSVQHSWLGHGRRKPRQPVHSGLSLRRGVASTPFAGAPSARADVDVGCSELRERGGRGLARPLSRGYPLAPTRAEWWASARVPDVRCALPSGSPFRISRASNTSGRIYVPHLVRTEFRPLFPYKPRSGTASSCGIRGACSSANLPSAELRRG